jgi:hypothetical protein
MPVFSECRGHASQTAAHDFDVKWCLRMNTCSAHEYIMFASTQLLRSWHEQWPCNQCDFDMSVMGEIGSVCYMGVGPASDFIFVL